MNKLTKDFIWNITSYVILGISGILINIILASYYDSEILGLFNLYYALFIFLSQLVGAGIHFSVLKSISQFTDSQDQKDILVNGLIAIILNAVVWLFFIYIIRTLFKGLFTKEEYIDLFIFLIPALFFFVLNKVFLSFRNAKKQMKFFAFFSALRPLLMVFSLGLLILFKTNPTKCITIFLYSEFILFFFLLLTTLKVLTGARISKKWILLHFNHGYKSAIGSVLIDVNTRVDVLMLGYFMNEKMVGIYSFASMIADGFNQLPIVFRSIINPYLTEGYFSKNKDDLRRKIVDGRNLTYKILVPLGFLLIIIYPLALKIFGYSDEYSGSNWPFAILLSGTLISIGYAPFLMIFNQTGHPALQSLLYFLIFATNLILNILLIPITGIYGAAIGTAISYALTFVFIKVLTRKYLKLSI